MGKKDFIPLAELYRYCSRSPGMDGEREPPRPWRPRLRCTWMRKSYGRPHNRPPKSSLLIVRSVLTAQVARPADGLPVAVADGKYTIARELRDDSQRPTVLVPHRLPVAKTR